MQLRVANQITFEEDVGGPDGLGLAAVAEQRLVRRVRVKERTVRSVFSNFTALSIIIHVAVLILFRVGFSLLFIQSTFIEVA
jgi:hypothetical protein